METLSEEILRQLLSWEDKNGLAVLSDQQKETVSELAELVSAGAGEFCQNVKDLQSAVKCGTDINQNIETTKQLAVVCIELEKEILKEVNSQFLEAESELLHWEEQVGEVDEVITSVLSALDALEGQYNIINEKTDSLRSTCLELITKKDKLNSYVEEIDRNLKYFADVENISAQLSSFTFSILSDAFPDILKRINECIVYMTEHSDYVEASQYLLRYRQCLSIALNHIRNYVKGSLETSTAQALEYLAKFDAEEVTRATSSTNAYAALYGKVRGPASKIKKVVGYLEENLANHSEYEVALLDCQNLYIAQRDTLMRPSIAGSVQDILNMKDTCSLLASGCNLMMRIVQDEYDLYFGFFNLRCPEFETYLENLLMVFYDGLRSRLIKVTHMETLAELCFILRVQMLTEYVVASENLGAFVRMTLQLLADIQERLVYRAHIYIQEDILGYKPAPGDLAYPEKLEMMESIAESLQQQPGVGGLKRSDSQLSMLSVASSVYEGAPKSRSGTSPADLHAMWYPPLRRALFCLSKLSRCIDRSAFQGLSQEILQAACTSIENAAVQIGAEKSPVDGLLFQIKHLLILREQIAPFQVDFAVKEINLDFSHFKTAAINVFQKPSRLFTLSSNNALLELLMDGAPHVKEQLKDSRRLADRQLKLSCESFINLVSSQIVGPMIDFISKAETFLKEQTEKKLSAEPWAKAEIVADNVAESQRNISVRLPIVQRSMQLYIANKETEFILYKPIKNQIVSTFQQLQQLLLSHYNEEDRLIVNMTSAEQVNINLSSMPSRTRARN